MSGRTTKKARARVGRVRQEGLAREYRFDYRKSRANRFARRLRGDAVVVVLDPDVADVFRSPKQVNSLLRAIAAAATSRSRRVG
jgi:hypothetical protein